MHPLKADQISVMELKEKKCQVEVYLAFSSRASIRVKVTGEANVYIVKRKGEEDEFWTFNESQAVNEFNRR